MDVNRIRSLLCVIEKGNMTEAAEELGYTPSGISRMIDSLEQELRVTLLNRGRSGVGMTRDCKALLPEMRELIRTEDVLKQKAADLAGAIEGDIAVGTAYGAYYRKLAGVIRAFSDRYPGIKVSIREGRSSLLMEWLEKGELDFCIISKREGKCDWVDISDDDFIAWVRQDHPAVRKGVYRLKDIEKDPYILLYENEETDSSRLMNRYGLKPNIKYSTSDTSAAYAMVDAGLGVTMVNKLFDGMLQGNVVSLELDPRVTIPIGIALTPDSMITPAARCFRDFAVPLLTERQ